jgi:hypothetical protein
VAESLLVCKCSARIDDNDIIIDPLREVGENLTDMCRADDDESGRRDKGMQESLTIGGLDQSTLALVRACDDLCGHRFCGIERRRAPVLRMVSTANDVRPRRAASTASR